MNWKLFLSIFSAVFVAELADKTQLVGISMASKSGRPMFVWMASVAAYMVVTLLSVYIGAALGDYLKPIIIRYIGATLFIIIGVLILFNKI